MLLPDGFPFLYFFDGIFSVRIQCSFKLKRKVCRKTLYCIFEGNIFFWIIWSRMKPDWKLWHLLLSMLLKRGEGKRGLWAAEVEKGVRPGKKLPRNYYSLQKVLIYWKLHVHGEGKVSGRVSTKSEILLLKSSLKIIGYMRKYSDQFLSQNLASQKEICLSPPLLSRPIMHYGRLHKVYQLSCLIN